MSAFTIFLIAALACANLVRQKPSHDVLKLPFNLFLLPNSENPHFR